MPVKVPKKQRKLGLLPDVLNIMLSWELFFNVSQVAATKGMFDGTDAASMDSEMGLPVLLLCYRLD
jgi:hypothetical protein